MVAEAVEFGFDLRHPAADVLRTLGDRVANVCVDAGAPCAAVVEELSNAPPQDFDAGLRVALHAAAHTHAIWRRSFICDLVFGFEGHRRP